MMMANVHIYAVAFVIYVHVWWIYFSRLSPVLSITTIACHSLSQLPPLPVRETKNEFSKFPSSFKNGSFYFCFYTCRCCCCYCCCSVETWFICLFFFFFFPWLVVFMTTRSLCSRFFFSGGGFGTKICNLSDRTETVW